MSVAIESHILSHKNLTYHERQEHRNTLIEELFEALTNAPTPITKSIKGRLEQPFNYATNMVLVRGDKDDQHNRQDINNFLQQFKNKNITITVKEEL
jgi:3-methyladenine DNA glycosylase AlkC